MVKLPVLRGAGVLIHSMILGIKALNFSANAILHETADAAAAEPALAGQTAALTSTVAGTAPAPAAESQPGGAGAKKTSNAAAAGAMIFAVHFNGFLFIVLPPVLTDMLLVFLRRRPRHA